MGRRWGSPWSLLANQGSEQRENCFLGYISNRSRFVPRKNEPAKESSEESSALPVQWMSRPYKPSRAANPARVIRKRMTSADLQAVGIRGDSSMSGVELVLNPGDCQALREGKHGGQSGHGLQSKHRPETTDGPRDRESDQEDWSGQAALAKSTGVCGCYPCPACFHGHVHRSLTQNPGSVQWPTTWGRSPGNRKTK